MIFTVRRWILTHVFFCFLYWAILPRKLKNSLQSCPTETIFPTPLALLYPLFLFFSSSRSSFSLPLLQLHTHNYTGTKGDTFCLLLTPSISLEFRTYQKQNGHFRNSIDPWFQCILGTVLLSKGELQKQKLNSVSLC